jgi:hypothetical protein
MVTQMDYQDEVEVFKSKPDAYSHALLNDV